METPSLMVGRSHYSALERRLAVVAFVASDGVMLVLGFADAVGLHVARGRGGLVASWCLVGMSVAVLCVQHAPSSINRQVRRLVGLPPS